MAPLMTCCLNYSPFDPFQTILLSPSPLLTILRLPPINHVHFLFISELRYFSSSLTFIFVTYQSYPLSPTDSIIEPF